jgi:hypothetical protein
VAHVAILVHPQDGFERVPYFLRECAAVWRDEAGLDVRVVDGSDRNAAPPNGELAILHVDLTVVPPDFLALAARYRRVLNGGVTDISKRRINNNAVRKGDGYAGPVILKTNHNSGGFPEGKLADRGSSLRRRVRRLAGQLSWRWRSQLPSAGYPVFDAVADVPAGAWRNPHLVVERFRPERRDGFYCLRTWIFFGEREINSLSYSQEPVVKGRNIVRREAVAEVPEELRRMRRELGFEFGKFDYGIMDGGEVVLYDANRTPTVGNFPREQFLPRVRLLAEGIRAFL